MTTFVDTNVLLDIATRDRHWAAWSLQQLEAAAIRGPLLINDVVYAELSVRYPRIEDAEEFIKLAGLAHQTIPREALFLAGKAFRKYRAGGGVRTGVLPDFFIGAHAAVLDTPLLTRDGARYRTYFPRLRLITP